MGHQLPSPEVTYVEHKSDKDFYAIVKKVTIYLTILTLIELACGLIIYKIHHGSPGAVFMIKILVGGLTLLKAFYITSSFMHLGDENKNFRLTILIPLLLFTWFIIAFLYEGNAWKRNKNTNVGTVEHVEAVHPAFGRPGIHAEH
ncbi:cytochrome C oxidase subunit IV family protein [Polluticaenibacter yanchengensis]|uniref:Cytochrome C oxidase subunit IV family protein n=1 Tax=Polluticaenibacter yanchengensis TaxID=3014562 RepID=A0ABT4UFX9_9BACT|nr:cytochrome C oxidase subunit IV family protein [Chitinophagaceae bacterium LY-5]